MKPLRVRSSDGCPTYLLWISLEIGGLTPQEFREGCAHASCPAGELLGAHAGDVYWLRLAGEIVERDSNQDGGGGTEEAVDGAYERSGIGE